MARKPDENQLNLFDLLAEELASPVESSTPVQEANPRLALSIDDLGGDPRSIPNDQRVRLIEHARELSNDDLLRSYYEASDAFTRAEDRDEPRSPVISDQYLRELGERRLAVSNERGEVTPPARDATLEIVPWGSGPERSIIARAEATGQAIGAELLPDVVAQYLEILQNEEGLTLEEARERYRSERYPDRPFSPTAAPESTREANTDRVIKPDPITFDPEIRPAPPQGVRGRAEANIQAIELLNLLDEQDRHATADEQLTLARYTSWGAAADVFNRSNMSYTDLRARLEASTTPEQYRQLEASTLTAYFTADEVIRPLWSLLDKAGYTGGPVLEPGSGTGNFLAYAPDTHDVVGVEVDPISARVSQRLYPDANIVNAGFEKFNPGPGSFVAAVGNVPFGDFKLHDPEHNQGSHSIHNHFITKSLDLVQPGGYVALVTSSYTSDSLSTAARQEMVSRADVISASRLPAGAFAEVAGTDVGTDVLVFRVREEGQQPTEFSQRFIETDELALGDETTLKVNGIFVDNPGTILGRPSIARDRFGKPFLRVTVDPDRNLEDRLTNRLSFDFIEAITEQRRFTARPEHSAEAIVARGLRDDTVTPGTVRYARDGSTIQFEEFDGVTGQWVEMSKSRGTTAQETVSLIELRDTSTALRDAYRDGKSGDVTVLQARLNQQYDSYVAAYGGLNRFEEAKPKRPTKSQQETKYNQLVAEWRSDNGEPVNAQPPADVQEALREQAGSLVIPDTKLRPHLAQLNADPNLQALRSIEDYDDETQTARKGILFSRNPAPAPREVTHVDSLADGVTVSLHRFGGIDPTFIAELAGMELREVEDGLITGNHAYRDPANPESFVRAEQYLSGVVKDKLAEAMHAARTDERFQANVDALTEVLPERISEGIEIRAGSTWIDQTFYEQFISETFNIPAHQFRLTHSNDQWSLEVPASWWQAHGVAHDMKYGLVAAHNYAGNPNYNFQSSTWSLREFGNQGLATNRSDGTVFTAIDMFQSVLNVSSPTVNHSKAWREAYPDSPMVHKEGTEFAQRRAAALREEFSRWASEDPVRHNALIDAYNERFNSYVPAKWRPRSPEVPGLGENFTPYSYQLNAVERMVNEPAVLLNHTVGAGKTGSFLMGAAELKRLGKISQPWVVVPNHLAEQIAGEATEWFPGARVLSGAGIQGADARRQFVAQTAAADWDFVIVPESVFGTIPVSQEKELAYLQAQEAELKKNLNDAAMVGGNPPTVKQMQRLLKANEARMNKVLDRPRDTGLEFEATGCDYLIVDEAHYYKNRFRASHVDDISHGGSVRAADLDLKLSTLRDRAAERSGYDNPVVTFATGTPLANNLAEIWVMAKYLRPDLLDHAGVGGINAWAATFTDQITMAEVPPQGIGLRSKTRTANFLNVGDLVALTEPFMDVVTRDQIEVKLPTRVTGDKNRSIEFDLDQESRDFIIDISERSRINWAEVVTGGNPASVDLALKQLSDGQKVSMDPRLVNLDYEGFSPRTRAVADELTRIWNETKDLTFLNRDGTESLDPGGLQIVFLDQGTPKADGSFSLYDQIRMACAERGMDPSRIEFVHDHDDDRDVLFERCRTGGVDVLIGSTPKLGTGANIQTRAVALHHVDVPWRPADLEQREGRIIRQGNQNDQIEICNYIARASTDAVRWQTILRKTQTIAQFTNADRSMRAMEPLENSTEEIAAQNRAAATGDSRYFDLLNLDKEVSDLEGRYQEWQATRESTKMARAHHETAARQAENFLSAATEHLPDATAWAASEDKTWELPGGTVSHDRAEATVSMTSVLRDVLRSRRDGQAVPVGKIGGVEFEANYTAYNSSATVTPAGLKVPSGVLTGRMSFNHSELGMPDRDGSATSAEYGAMSRMENFVRNLPELVYKVESNLDAIRIQQRQLTSEHGSETFTDLGRLTEATKERDRLQETLAKVDESAAAKREKALREERLAAKGRELGWSLRLNPTKGYADLIEHTTPEEVIYRAKTDELDALFNNSYIDADEYELRHNALPRPEPQDSEPGRGREPERDASLGETVAAQFNQSRNAAPVAQAPQPAEQHARDAGNEME